MSEHIASHRKTKNRRGKGSEQMERTGRVERHEILIILGPEKWDQASTAQWYEPPATMAGQIETGDWITFQDPINGREIRRRVWGRITGYGPTKINFKAL